MKVVLGVTVEIPDDQTDVAQALVAFLGFRICRRSFGKGEYRRVWNVAGKMYTKRVWIKSRTLHETASPLLLWLQSDGPLML
jgi:hypothetical protein